MEVFLNQMTNEKCQMRNGKSVFGFLRAGKLEIVIGSINLRQRVHDLPRFF